MAKVVVTGATGFIGPAACRALLADGHAVTGVTRRPDRLPNGVTPQPVRDIGPDTDWLDPLFGAEVVVHCAARVPGPHESREKARKEFQRVNAEGTRALAQAAAAKGVKRFVFLSTVKVLGEASDVRPFRDTDRPAPAEAYSESKLQAEEALQKVAGDMETVVLRPPVVHGPGATGNMERLMRAIQRGRPLPVGRVTARRSVLGVDNLGEAVRLAVTERRAAGGTFLVRDDEDPTLPDLVRRLARALGYKPRIVPVPVEAMRFAGRLTGRQAGIARLTSSLVVEDSPFREATGYRPVVDLDTGLARMARWFRARQVR